MKNESPFLHKPRVSELVSLIDNAEIQCMYAFHTCMHFQPAVCVPEVLYDSGA